MIYWTEWGSEGLIAKASMDGRNQVVIHNTSLVWPNALTLDIPTQTLYWADASLDKVERSGVDGSNRQLLASLGVGHPYGISFDNNIIYFSDWEGRSIKIVNSTGGIARILHNLTTCTEPFGIQVVDNRRQPISE